MPSNPKQSLVLFDWDGYTAILNSSRIRIACRLGGPLFVSCLGTLSYDGGLQKVEVLQLSDSKEELEDFDSDWAQTHRAKAISEEGDRRQNSRGRAKTGGYLDIWNDPDSDNQEEAHEDLPDPNDQVATVPPVTDKRPGTREIKGSKDRKVTVMDEGSSSTSPLLSPKRQPCYFDELETDDVEVIRLHMRTHKEGKMCSSSQTEKVVVNEDEAEILDLIASRKKRW